MISEHISDDIPPQLKILNFTDLVVVNKFHAGNRKNLRGFSIKYRYVTFLSLTFIVFFFDAFKLVIALAWFS